MDDAAVFRLICAAAKSKDLTVRMDAMALIAKASETFCKRWAE